MLPLVDRQMIAKWMTVTLCLASTYSHFMHYCWICIGDGYRVSYRACLSPRSVRYPCLWHLSSVKGGGFGVSWVTLIHSIVWLSLKKHVQLTCCIFTCMISRKVQSLIDRRTLTGRAQWVCITIRRLQDISISLYSCFRPANSWIRAFELWMSKIIQPLRFCVVLCIARSVSQHR